jgi:hypothetical protein
MIMSLFRMISSILIYILKPIKLFAFQAQSPFLKRLLIEFTAFVDFIIQWFYSQNEVMKIHQKVYGGNFIFGYGVMITDYKHTVGDLPRPSHRTNNFMGVSVVSGNEVFVVNTPMISMGEPFRTLARQHLDNTVFTPDVAALNYEQIKTKCAPILQEWLEDKNASNITVMRSTCTRMIILLLQDILISKADGEAVTAAYLKHFFELSLFRRHLPYITGLLGSEKNIKKNAFYRLRDLGVSNDVIDATLFAAMFSIGTLFVRCVGDIHRHGIDYTSLDIEKRRNFIIESVRLFPTVTTTHRIVESDETVTICGKPILLTAGDEIVYPLVCANTDASVFECPHQMKVERSEEEYDKVLSWSKGAHSCPAKELSILVIMVMLDTLNQKIALSKIDYGDAIV